MNEIFKNNDIALKINLLNIYFDYLRIDHKDDKKEEEEEKGLYIYIYIILFYFNLSFLLIKFNQYINC